MIIWRILYHVLLDPWFKKELTEFRLRQTFGSDDVEHLGVVEATLHGLFKEYFS
jgi:hypothetical protein